MTVAVDPPSTSAPREPSWAKPALGIFAHSIVALAIVVSWWAGYERIFDALVGGELVNATAVVNYYFGSSSGSDRKTALLATRP